MGTLQDTNRPALPNFYFKVTGVEWQQVPEPPSSRETKFKSKFAVFSSFQSNHPSRLKHTVIQNHILTLTDTGKSWHFSPRSSRLDFLFDSMPQVEAHRITILSLTVKRKKERKPQGNSQQDIGSADLKILGQFFQAKVILQFCRALQKKTIWFFRFDFYSSK